MNSRVNAREECKDSLITNVLFTSRTKSLYLQWRTSPQR